MYSEVIEHSCTALRLSTIDSRRTKIQTTSLVLKVAVEVYGWWRVVQWSALLDWSLHISIDQWSPNRQWNVVLIYSHEVLLSPLYRYSPLLDFKTKTILFKVYKVSIYFRAPNYWIYGFPGLPKMVTENQILLSLRGTTFNLGFSVRKPKNC